MIFYPLIMHRQLTMYSHLIRQFIAREVLPASYQADVELWFLPLLEQIVEHLNTCERPFLIGINGAQGTGKSTLARLMSSVFAGKGLNTVNLSLDDFYYSRKRRQLLAQSIHPLLVSRGVPGTHDTGLLREILISLAALSAGRDLLLPAFDKAADDPVPKAHCPRVRGPVDIIVLEGWCIGLRPQSEAALARGINPLERGDDQNGAWRRYVNTKLAEDYQEIFAQLAMLIMLQAPSFEQVLQWRSLQEEKLRARQSGRGAGLMDAAALRRFIQHFERLTRHSLDTVPEQADVVFNLNEAHRVAGRRGEWPCR